ncbi:hypothetical protein BH23ACT9_BH23ACT9_03790 [soil metagenome]
MRGLGLVLAAALALSAVPVQTAVAQTGAVAAICADDRTDDQRAPRNPDRPDEPAEVDGASDLVEVCIDGTTVRVTTAAPTGLGEDSRWIDGASAITVGIALDQARIAYLVIAPGTDGAVIATRTDGGGTVGGSCPVVVQGATVTAGPGCLPAGATAVGIQASLRLHSDPQREYAPVIEDIVPDGGGFATAGGGRIGAPVGATRLAGPDRFATAAVIAAGQFPDGAEVAYLARGDDLADAIAGGALRDGPVLLVPACGPVPAVVTTEIARLRPQSVIALGGEAAVCDAVLGTVATGRTAGRIAGPDRFTTAAEIAARAFPGGAEDVFLARGDDLADAVAAGVLTTGPVLLVPSCGALPEGVVSAVQRMLPNRIIALGGTQAVCEDVLTAADDQLRHTPQLLRLGGADRFATAALIAERRSPGGSPVVYLARADDQADAVAGGSLTGGPILLVPRCGGLPPSTGAALAELRPDRVVSLGGDAAVCDATLTAAEAARTAR